MKSRSFGSVLVFALAAAGVAALILFRSVAIESCYPAVRIQRVLSRSIGTRICGLVRGASAEAENAVLRREVAALSILRADNVRLEVENARLRRALGYVSHRSENWIPAEVLSVGGGAASAHDLIRVGKGSDDGVRSGAVVAVPEGLVGLVTAVTPHTADVMLVTDPSLKVACEVGDEKGVEMAGILCGGNAENLILRHIRRGLAVRTGGEVRTSGRGGVFPRGLRVGMFQPLTNDLFVTEGLVTPFVSYLTLEDVFIRHEK